MNIQLPAKELTLAIKICLKVAPKNDVRYFLNGVHFDCSEDHIHLVATDGHRLVWLKFGYAVGDQGGVDVPSTFVLRRHDLEVILKAMGTTKGLNEPITINVKDDGEYSATDGDLGISGKIIDGKYPDWRKIAHGDWSDHGAETPEDGIGIQARYLADAMNIVSMAGQTHSGVSMKFKGELDPIYIEVYDKLTFMDAGMVISPMKK